MKMQRNSWQRRAIQLFCALNLILATALPAFAQEPEAHGVVGWEVRSTNTPGGGGELSSQGLTGRETPWMDVQIGPTTAGTAVTNMVITYYHCKECRDEAKKKREEAKKKREEERKRKDEERKKKSEQGKTDKPKPKPADVPTFDPRTHELKDGKVVPKTPKSQDAHQNCPRPDRFECGEHYQWWLQNHDHQTAIPNLKGHEHCDRPPKFECGEHYRWWRENHRHRTEPLPKVREEDRYDSLDRKVKKTALAPDPDGWQIVMTGTVVEGETATASVLDADGAMISGVVLELPNGEKTTTDGLGRAMFRVPDGLEAITLAVAGTKIMKSAWAYPSDDLRPYLPARQTPKPIVPGQATAVVTPGTSGNPEIWVDGRTTQVLASSPTSAIADMPYGLSPGAHHLTVRDGGHVADLQVIEAVRLRVDPPKTLVKGQRAAYDIVVQGTEQPVTIQVRNQSPTVVKMVDAPSSGIFRTCGGSHNQTKIEIDTVGPGEIRMEVYLSTMSPDLNYLR